MLRVIYDKTHKCLSNKIMVLIEEIVKLSNEIYGQNPRVKRQFPIV
jgi:hypothetical protein